MNDLFWITLFLGYGLWAILHTAKAVRTGSFHGWYNFTWKDYYIKRVDSPFWFWFDTLSMALMGSFFIALALIIADMNWSIFQKFISFIHNQ
ncbi:hypothetical protein F7769_15605 [Salmonella enterica subsp. diarizonae]|nr:hypothetical protein [Salmonella enterica subsp. diarizonae]EDQ5532281.1 hypothetical protein [Salmonella enterica subsp. diarizonae]